jgi:hypothetical protein
VLAEIFQKSGICPELNLRHRLFEMANEVLSSEDQTLLMKQFTPALSRTIWARARTSVTLISPTA